MTGEGCFMPPLTLRHCERSEAIHSFFARRDGLLRFARNDGRRDGLLRGACHRARIRATRWLAMTAPLFAMTAKLLRRGADWRTAGRPVQECDRCKRAKPRTDRREGDIDP